MFMYFLRLVKKDDLCFRLDHPKVNLGKLSKSKMKYFTDLMLEMREMVSNDSLYQLLLLLTLLDTEKLYKFHQSFMTDQKSTTLIETNHLLTN